MKKTALPMEPNHKEYSRKEFVRFSEWRGHVYLMEIHKDDRLRFDIWEMRVDYTGWNVKSYVDLSTLITEYPGYDRFFFFKRFNLRVLLVEKGEDSSLRLILSIADHKVISFDLKINSFKEMYYVKKDVWVQGFEYIETLAHG